MPKKTESRILSLESRIVRLAVLIDEACARSQPISMQRDLLESYAALAETLLLRMQIRLGVRNLRLTGLPFAHPRKPASQASPARRDGAEEKRNPKCAHSNCWRSDHHADRRNEAGRIRCETSIATRLRRRCT
jgi:hypothetical protein